MVVYENSVCNFSSRAQKFINQHCEKILNRSPLNNAKHQTLIQFVCNRRHQVHVPALIMTQLGLRKTLYHHSESYPKANIN